MALNFDHQRNRVSSSSNVITINSTGGLTLPVGTTGERTSAAQGMIRYNTTDNRFEAYDGSVWSGLGGVIDADQNTYIIAESSPGANNNELDFYTNGTRRLQIGSSGNLLFGDTLNKFTVAYATGNTAIAGTLNVTGQTTLASASVTDLTANRVVYAGVSGELQDSSNLTFNGSALALTGALTVSSTLTINSTTAISSILDEDTMISNSATALATQQSIKAYVDSVSSTQTLNIAGTSGSGTVNLSTQTLTIAGTTNEIEAVASGQTITVGLPNDVTVSNNLTVTGNLTVNGTTTTVNTTTVTVKDPVITIGGVTELDTDDNKDRGIEFRWHNGTLPKLGFFGFDDSTGYFTFIPDATNTGEVFSGTAGSAAFHAVYATHLTGSNIQIGLVGSNEINTSSGNITIDSAGGTTTINDILLVNGATTVNSLNVKDTAIVLNSDETGSPASDVYITVERGTSNNVNLRWNETTEVWEQTSNGTNYYRIVSTDDDYIANLTAGTGISISHTPSAGSTATISTANIPNSSLTNSAITITDGATSQVIDLGETITFADGTDINVVVSATNTVTLNHNVGGANTSASAATNTFANSYTVTSQGHVTAIGTGTVSFNVADNYAFKSITDGTNTAIADSNTDTFKIRSTDQIEVTVTNDDVTHGDSLLIGHADSGVTANTYGNTTSIPVITIDAQGHITSASTASISTQWTITDGTTSQTVNGGDTLTLVDGTDINIVVSATDTVTINNTSTFDTVTDRGATTTNNITVGGATVSNLTNNRIVIAGASGILSDSSNLTFDGSILTATAQVNITGDLDVDNININGNTISSTDTNGNIIIESNGTGDIQLNADTIRVGDSNSAVLVTSNGTGNIRIDTNAGINSGYVLINAGTNSDVQIEANGTGSIYNTAAKLIVGKSNAAASVTTNGTGNLTLNTNSGTNSGSIVLTQGVNGNITLTPNGTGEVVLSTAAVSDLTVNRIVFAGASGALSDSSLFRFDSTNFDIGASGSEKFRVVVASGNTSIGGSLIFATGVSVNTILDEDTMTSNSASALATQQSIKAYVDTVTAANSLAIAGGTGSSTVNLATQTFTVAGTTNEIETSVSGQTVTIGLPNNVTIGNTLTITGDLIVNGTTTTVNSTTVTLDDPILTLGGDTAPSVDDNKDRGIEFRYYSGSAKIGFFGFDDSTGYFTFIPDATNTSEVFSGTKGVLDVTSITGSAASWTSARTITLGGDLTGNVSIDGSGDVTLTATIASNSVALGTDTTGNYVTSITNGSYITGADAGSESAALTLSVDATSANTVSKVVARDASGNFSAGTITAALSGNATTATTWATARTITLGGDLTGNVSINGGADVTLTATIASNSVALGTDTTGNYVTSITNGTYILGADAGSESAALTLSVDATSTNTVSKVVARDASGDFSAGIITAALSGNATTATTWATARTITLGGDLTGNVSINGSADVTLTATIASNSVALGTDTTGDYVATVSAGTSGVQTGSSGLTITGTGEGSSVTIAHADTSSVSNLSSDNSNGVVLQDISFTFDTYGHATAASVVTLDLDGRYYTETEADNNFVNVSGDTLTGYLTLHADPANPLHAVTKQYVDAVAEGLHVHEACLVATTDTLATLSSGTISYDNGTSGVGATLTTTGSYTTIDTVTLANTNRILVKDEATAAHNGIYTRTSSTVLTRATDHDSPTEMAGGDFVFVTGGDQYDNTGWVQEANVVTVGSTAVSFVQFSGQGTYDAGTGLQLLGSIFSIDSTVVTLTGSQTLTNKTLTSPTISGLYISNGSITFEGATADAFETTLAVTDPTADRIITFPDINGTVITSGDTATVTNTMLAGSIENTKLSNSSVTVGSTNIALGATSTTLAGLSSVTSTSFVGALTGNADTATVWATSRTITLGGDLTGNVSINGSSDVTLTATIAANSVALGTDTTGNYVTSITNGTYILGADGGSESAALTLSVDATSANTVSKIVARDASGDFSAGIITASLSGNASTASAWATARTITLGGDLTGNVSINGSSDVTLTATIAANSVALGTDTTGNYVAAGAVSGNGLSGSASSEGATFTVTSNATNANTPSTIVFRDANGDFSAGIISAALTGNVTGNASTATTLATTRTLWGQNFNGGANVTGNLTSVGDITGTSAIVITAGGSNQNITITPSGTGYTLLNGNVGINIATPLEKLHVDGAVRIDSTYNLDSATATIASVSQTAIASFSSTTFGGGKVIIQAYDSVTGNRTICELLIVHNGSTASATEYGIINTGVGAIATYDVDINSGNVRILATGASSNSTQYKVVQTLILA